MIYHGDALQYILDTPGVMKEIIEKEDVILQKAIDCIAKEEYNSILIIGTGSSYYAAKAVQYFYLSILQRPVYVIYPTEWNEYVYYLKDPVLVVGISQQGTSVSVIEALDKARNCQMTTISVTGEYDTEITRHSRSNLYIECGYEDAGATTKGYTATILTLQLLGLRLAEQYGFNIQQEKHKIKKMPVCVRQVLDHYIEEIEMISDKLASFQHLILVADERFRLILPEIVLKFSETCRRPVQGFELEEFVHGIYNTVNNQTVFLFLLDSKGNKKMKRLEQYYKDGGYQTICIDHFSQESENGIPYNLIVYLQYLIVSTSRKKGIDLNIPKDPDFHKYMGSKIE